MLVQSNVRVCKSSTPVETRPGAHTVAAQHEGSPLTLLLVPGVLRKKHFLAGAGLRIIVAK
eukprot:scaffold141794_cov20-Tisochrysis_lutea.AAC.1